LARLSRSVQEVRIVYSNRPSSLGAKTFVTKYYTQVKRLNPRLPVLVRPGDDEAPRIIARYDYGGTAHRALTGLSVEECLEKLKELQQIGTFALKADIYPWQESVPKDKDIVDYDRQDPAMHQWL